MTLDNILIESGLDPNKLKALGLWPNITEVASLLVDVINHEAQEIAAEDDSKTMEECIVAAKWRVLPR